MTCAKHFGMLRFQSTRPVRGGTLRRYKERRVQKFQSTRPVRGGTHFLRQPFGRTTISIHPPRAGRDDVALGKTAPYYVISIHPPRAGRDGKANHKLQQKRYFNPPAPCGAGRSVRTSKKALTALFQSTRPVRGGTSGQASMRGLPEISIHPPRAGRDFCWS